MAETEPINVKKETIILAGYVIFYFTTSLLFLIYQISKVITHGPNKINIFFIIISILPFILAKLPKNKILTIISKFNFQILCVTVVGYSIHNLLNGGTGWDLLFGSTFLAEYIISAKGRFKDDPLGLIPRAYALQEANNKI